MPANSIFHFAGVSDGVVINFIENSSGTVDLTFRVFEVLLYSAVPRYVSVSVPVLSKKVILATVSLVSAIRKVCGFPSVSAMVPCASHIRSCISSSLN